MRTLAALLAGLAMSPAWAEPPQPCLSAPSYQAAITGLQQDGWVALPPDEPVADVAALPLGLAMTLADKGDLPALHEWKEAHEYAQSLRERIVSLAGLPGERVAILTRGTDSVFVRASGEPDAQALFYCFAVLARPNSLTPSSGSVVMLDRRDTSDGWITTARFDADLLRKRVRAPVSITAAYDIVRHLQPTTTLPAATEAAP